MGEGTVLMASGGLLSLFKVFFSTCALIVACASDHGGGWPFLAKPASAMGKGTVSMASGGLLSLFKHLSPFLYFPAFSTFTPEHLIAPPPGWMATSHFN
ncbi:unnamed protein product [Boreogadus saida]